MKALNVFLAHAVVTVLLVGLIVLGIAVPPFGAAILTSIFLACVIVWLVFTLLDYYE